MEVEWRRSGWSGGEGAETSDSWPNSSNWLKRTVIRARFMEERWLRSKDGSEHWRGPDSAQIIAGKPSGLNLSHVLFDRGSKVCSGRNPAILWAKFSKETIAGAHRVPKWVPHYSKQADSGRAHGSQALFRLYSGSALACSPLARVKAVVVCVCRLKRNQRK